jgi:hypothetical protein
MKLFKRNEKQMDKEVEKNEVFGKHTGCYQRWNEFSGRNH